MSNLRRSDNSNESMVLSLIQVHLVLEFKYTNGLIKIRIEIFQRSICIAIATKDYTRKRMDKEITPGISTYNSKDKFGRIWQDHYSELLKFAEGIIPSENNQKLLYLF